MVNPDTSDGFRIFGDSDERFRVKGGNSKVIEALTKQLGNDTVKRNYKLISFSDTDNDKYHLSSMTAKQLLLTM